MDISLLLERVKKYIDENTPKEYDPKTKTYSKPTLGKSLSLSKKVVDEGLINPTTPGNIDNANRFKDSLFGGLGIVPGIGDAASVAEAADYFNRGENLNAGLASLGALPLIPSMGGIIKAKGGNWIDKGFDSIGSFVDDLKHGALGETHPEALRHMREELDDPTAGLVSEKLGKWTDKKITNYIRNEMGTEADPIRKLFDEGVYHSDPEDMRHMYSELIPLAEKRKAAGYPETGIARTDAGSVWENLVDWNVYNIRPEVRQLYNSTDPWIENIPDSEEIYRLVAGPEELGFDNLIKRAFDIVDESSDIPNHLKMDINKLDKVSLPDMIRQIDKVNKWRTQILLEEAVKNRVGVPVVAEFDDGFKVIELNRPGMFASESDIMGHSVRGYEPPKGHPDWIEPSGNQGYSQYGHGGWDAIKRGDAKVLSLVDNKGAARATVELKKSQPVDPIDYFRNNALDDESISKIIDETRDEFSGKTTYETFSKRVNKKLKDHPIYQSYLQSLPEYEVTQIKGPKNGKPDKEAIKDLSKFLKSTGYPIKNDLQNSGLIDMGDFTGNRIKGLMTKEEAIEAIRQFEKSPEWIEQVNEHKKRYGADLSLDNWIKEIMEE